MDDARAVKLQEGLTGTLVIDIVPEILRKHSDFNALLIFARYEVLLHVGTNVLHLVQELQVVRLQEIHLEERIERE